jgi:hypothetical protein
MVDEPVHPHHRGHPVLLGCHRRGEVDSRRGPGPFRARRERRQAHAQRGSR